MDFSREDCSEPLLPQSNPQDISNIDQNEILSFDEVLSKIGFGKYQIIVYIIMGLLAFSEGAQLSAITVMIPVLETQWKISDFQNSLQASLIFISIMIGSFLSGQIADRFGRKKPILYSLGFFSMFSFLTVFAPEIQTLIFLRCCMGIIIGFSGPLGTTYLTELTPQKLRGRYMSVLTATLSFGQLYGYLVSYFVLDNLQKGNWRILILFCAIPILLSWILAILFLEESPRYEIVFGKFEHCFQLIENLCKFNDCKSLTQLNSQQQNQLKNWSEEINKDHENNEIASIKALFRKQGKLVTPILWFNWFASAFGYYGILVFMPYILGKQTSHQGTQINFSDTGEISDIGKLFLSNFSEILSVGLASALIEIKSFGRKNSMIIFYGLTFLFSIMTAFDDQSRFVLWATISKLFLAMTFIFLFQFTSEFYSTKFRTTGLGLANAVGRFGGILMPWICMLVIQVNNLAPFFTFAIISLLASIITYFLPFDTTNMELDQIKSGKEAK